MKQLPDQSTRWGRYGICAGMLVYFTQVTLLFPVLPPYVLGRWPTAGVGYVVGALAAGLLCFRPLIGWLIDRTSSKLVLRLGLGLLLVALPLYLWSPTPLWLMGARMLHGVSQAAFATASQTLLVELVPPAQRAAWLGYLAMCNTIGFAIGPWLGSVVLAQTDFSRVVWLMGALTGLGLILSLPLPGQPRGAINAGPSVPERAAFPWKIILRFPVREATLLFLINSFLHGAVVTFLPLFVPQAALFYSLNALVAVLIRFALGRWGNRISRRWVVSLGLLGAGMSLIGLSVAPQVLPLWAVLYGLGFGSLFPVLAAIVATAAPAAGRGRVYSVFLAGFDSGMTLGGAGIQPFVQGIALDRLFLGLGGIGCGASLAAFWQLRDRQTQPGSDN